MKRRDIKLEQVYRAEDITIQIDVRIVKSAIASMPPASEGCS